MNLMQVTTHIVFFTFLMRDDLPKRQKQIIQSDHFNIFNIYIKIFAKNPCRFGFFFRLRYTFSL